MAQVQLPKPPETAKKFDREIYLWLNRIYIRLSQAQQILWDQLDTSAGTATTTSRGLVLKAAAVSDATASTASGSTSSVSVTSPNATDLASAITLVNEIKADVNTLVSNVNTLAGDLDTVVSDLNATITQVNAALASLRTSGVLNS